MRRFLTLLVMAGFATVRFAAAQNADPTGVPDSTQTKVPDAPKKMDAQAKKEEQARIAAEKREAEQDTKRKVKVKDDPNEIGNRNVAGGANFYSLEREIALGKGLAQDVEREAKIVDDPVISEYVNRVGQNIVRNSDAKVPFTIKVVQDDSVNAFALPGGFFFVNTGLILKAQTEAELAGVMAHEIAHVAARHGTRQDTKGQLVSYASIATIFMGGGLAGYGIRQGLNLLIPVTFLKFSRGYEEEADNLGLQYMYKSGYDPAAFVDFFEKIQAMDKKKPGTISQYFSSHPPTASRIEKAQDHIQKNLDPRPEYLVTTSEFNKVKARLAMLENRRKGDTTNPKDDRPTLKQTPHADDGDAGGQADDKDERPKLERR